LHRAQSFLLDDLEYWIKAEPAFGKQAVFLDNRYDTPVEEMVPSMAELAAMGVKIVAPAMWRMITTDANGVFKASPYTKAAKANGLDMIAWTLERSGPFPQVFVSFLYASQIYFVPFCLSSFASLLSSFVFPFPLYLYSSKSSSFLPQGR
jgi:hypothetical protein